MAHDLKKKWRSKDVQLQEKADFSVMLLSDRVLSGLTKAGFKTPSPIQLEAIPIGRFGKDLLVQAKSGTGKTLVFTIVALEMLKPKLFRPQVLILAPTREIASQICSVIKSVGSSFHKLTCFSFIGGLPVVEDKERALSCQIAVGTPGRVRQLITLGSMPTNSIRLLVFDEADELLQGTFKLELDEIFKSLPKDKQVIATSATYPSRLRKVIFQYLKDPFIACLNATDLALLGIVHYSKVVNSSLMPLLEYKNKLAALEQLLTKLKFCQCLVFCNMISRVEVLCKDIKKWGFSTSYISSAKEQGERLKAIDRLKHFKCKVLVSSDVTSRGIDAENVDLVINFDLAITTETYLHRVGRAGRYGSIGLAVTILTEKQLLCLKKIEQEAAFRSHKLPEPLPKDLIRNPYIGEYTFEVEEPAQGMGEGSVQPVVCDGEIESADTSPYDDTFKENYSVELRHGAIEKTAKSLIESASENNCEKVNASYAKNDSVPTENESLTIVPELEKIDPETKSISPIKDDISDTYETNCTNVDIDTKDSSDKNSLSNDKIYITDLETKKVNFTKDNKPFDIIQILEDFKVALNPEMENGVSSVEVSKITNKLNPDCKNCTEDVIKSDSCKKCPKTGEVNIDKICNIPEISSTDNVNKKLDDLLDGTIQSFQKKLDDLIDSTIQYLGKDEADGKDSGLSGEKSFVTEENDADDNLSELNFTIQNYILNYESKLLQNESEVCSSIPFDDSGISNGMIKNLMSEKRDYIYSVLKEYEKNNSALQAAAEIVTNETTLNMNFEILSDDRSSDLNKECKKIDSESLSIAQKVENLSKDQSEEKAKVCDQEPNAGLESVKTIKDQEICDKVGEKIISEPLDSSDNEFHDNHSINKLFQSTPFVDNRFSLKEVTKDIRIFGESSSEDSDSNTVSSPSRSSIDADMACNKKFSPQSSSDSELDSDSSCDISSSEKRAKFRKNLKISPEHKDQPKGSFGLCVPNNFESCNSDFNPLPQSQCKKLPSKNFNTRRFFREQRQDSLNTQSEYSSHQIPKNPDRCHFDHDSMPWSHHCQPVSLQHYTGHCSHTAFKPRYGRRGNHLPLRCQKAAKSFELHHTQGATSCCASSECNYHSLSNATSDGRCRHDTPCCSSSTAYINPYDIFYQQWQYLQRCMNAPF